MIVSCRHELNGRQVPCPPMCTCQDWPRYMFRVTLLGRYKLRRRYRDT